MNGEELKDAVSNYLKADNAGVLLVNGVWGCGKTHFFKQELFPYIKEQTERIPIMVSLFGIKDLNEIPLRIFSAYMDVMGNKIADDVLERDNDETDTARKDRKTLFNRFRKKPESASGNPSGWAMGLGTWGGKILKFAQNIPWIRDKVDLNGLIACGDALYWFVPSDKVLICLDDMERILMKESDKDDLMGIVNNLVENHGYKMIAIANEQAIRNDIYSNFKEKVIYKTLAYSPDIPTVFSNLVRGKGDEAFSDFMQQEDILSVVSTEQARTKEHKDNLSNIRILKFAIDSFYSIFSYYKNRLQGDEPTVRQVLQNVWLFVVAVSIEYKKDRLSSTDCHGIDALVDVSNLSLDLDENEMTFGMPAVPAEQDEEEKAERDRKYADKFHHLYFKSVHAGYYFYADVYQSITAGSTMVFEQLDAYILKIQEENNVEVHPAQALLGEFLYGGFWNFTNDEAKKKLDALYGYAVEGLFPDYTSYVNAATYILRCHDIIGVDEKTAIKFIKKGIDTFFEHLQQPQPVTSGFAFIRGSIDKRVHSVYDYIKQKDEELARRCEEQDTERLKQLFEQDFPAFCKSFLPHNQQASPYFMKPVLFDFDAETVKNKLHRLQPAEISPFSQFLNERYINQSHATLPAERPFVEQLKAAVDDMKLDDQLLSKVFMKDWIAPLLEKILTKQASSK
ncbi:MAG: hypothetical protein IJV27_04270 [Prevotella sp.]|nr:hypothetical protein [Prevotella sp.]